MLLIVKNKKPYNYVVTTATCIGEALYLAETNGKTIGSEKGAHHTDHTAATIHEDWLLIDAKTDEIVKLPTNELERWRARYQWESAINAAKPHETFEERWHRKRHGHKRQAWGGKRNYRAWRHNARSEFEYGSEVEIPTPKLKRDLHWECPAYRKLSKSWKDQSKRRHQHYRVVEM